MDKVWLVEFIEGNSGKGFNGFRVFKNKDGAYKAKFELKYKFYKETLEDDIDFYEKCKEIDNSKIELRQNALSHLDTVLNSTVSWEQKTQDLCADVIPKGDYFIDIPSVCCSNLAPAAFIHELNLE